MVNNFKTFVKENMNLVILQKQNGLKNFLYGSIIDVLSVGDHGPTIENLTCAESVSGN